MLREIKKTGQKAGEPKKRWFSSQSMDLFIWFDSDEAIMSYQFTYDKPHDEKALIWNKEDGLSHMGVDDGSRSGKHPGSPLLVFDAAVSPDKVISLILKNAGELDSTISKFIISGIEKRYKLNARN